MKKYVIALFTFMISYSVFAQDKLNTGLNIGYTSSTFIGNDKPGKGLASVSSGLIGGYVRYCFSKKFSIQPEIDIYAKGSRINTIDNLYEYVYLDYIELPVLLIYKFRNDRKLQPVIYTGPYFAINTDASGSRGYLNNVRKIDAGINAGAGLEIWKLSFQFRYTYGLTRFDNSNQNLDLRNSAMSVLVGFNFINKKQK